MNLENHHAGATTSTHDAASAGQLGGGIDARRGARIRARLTSLSRRLLLAVACLAVASVFLLSHAPTTATNTTNASNTTSAANATGATSDASGLLETGQPPQPHAATTTPAPAEIKIVSYNIRWRAGDDLAKIIAFLREDAEIGRASVIGMQEVDRNKRRTGNVNTARVIADALGMHYAWAAPPAEKGAEEEETGVALFSPYPLSDVVRLVLPHEGPNQRRRAGIGATVHIGAQAVRVYSIHAETRLAVAKKVDQWRAAIEDLARYPQVKRAVVIGDFNTIKGKDKRHTRELFTREGFTTPIPDKHSTFRRAIFLKFKLDWIWVRGLEATGGGITRRLEVSDHWPLWVKAKMETTSSGK